MKPPSRSSCLGLVLRIVVILLSNRSVFISWTRNCVTDMVSFSFWLLGGRGGRKAKGQICGPLTGGEQGLPECIVASFPSLLGLPLGCSFFS